MTLALASLVTAPSLLLWLLAVLACLALGTLVVPNEGEGKILEYLVNKSAPADCVLILYSNNVSITKDSVLADFTEVSGGGYAAKTLTGASWTVTPGSPSQAAYAAQTFTFSGVPSSANVYGYVIKSNGKVVAAEVLPSAPFVVNGAGDAVTVTPQITAASVTSD